MACTSPEDDGMYHTECETLKARKPHRCMSCGEAIAAGETYKRWRTYDGGDAGTNKMHPECLAMHQADADKYGHRGEWEYSPYGHERPKPDPGLTTASGQHDAQRDSGVMTHIAAPHGHGKE
jgi:hypothetical protein